MKKIANFHTHTYLCHHAKGAPAHYTAQAIKEGCTALGFSDHCPYPDNFEDIWPNIRMGVNEVPQYFAEIEQARKIAPFPIYAGFECEYDARFLSWYRDELLGAYNAQYLVLGSHWVTIGNSHKYCPNVEGTELNRYIDQTIDGMRTGLFAFLAHPDLFMMSYKEWDAQSKACLGALLDAAIDLDMPLEINGLGCSREPNNTANGMRYPYPYVEFWEMVADSKARVICNSDAHESQTVILNAWKARDFAGRFGIIPQELPDFAKN